jgi:xanthine dehydrogenase small subunit
MKNRQNIVAFINERRVEIPAEKSFQTLANHLRDDIGLCGTKIVCAEGDCGACTVLVKKGDEYQAVNSCIMPLYLLDGAHIISVEGIQDGDKLHPVQESMVNCQGAQCGYCTPGFICAMAAMTDSLKTQKKEITEKRARNFLTGNLCRCTGYRPILEASVATDLAKTPLLSDKFKSSDRDREQEQLKKESVTIGDKVFLPITLSEALEHKKNHPDVRLSAGSTDLGVVVNKGRLETPQVMSLYRIADLGKLAVENKALFIGATVTLTQLERYIEDHVPELSRLFHIFASPQIKNQGTLIGNVVNASPIGDTIPFLMVMEAIVQIESTKGKRQVPLTQFYLGYKKLDLTSDEIVTGILLPLPEKDDLVKLYKVSVRKDLDISAVTFAAHLRASGENIKSARIALGGVGPTVLRLPALEAQMTGQKATRDQFKNFGKIANTLINPLSDLRGSSDYRRLVCANLFVKFFDECKAEGRL